MAEQTMRNVLVLQFADANGTKKHNLRVPDPRPDLTATEVKSVMDLVADNSFVWPGVKVLGAKVVKTMTDVLDITVD